MTMRCGREGLAGWSVWASWMDCVGLLRGASWMDCVGLLTSLGLLGMITPVSSWLKSCVWFFSGIQLEQFSFNLFSFLPPFKQA